MFWIKRPSSEKSVTLTFFMIGYYVATLKLLLSGVTIGTFIIIPFSGLDYAGVVGALGAVYAMRRSQAKKVI